VEREPVGLSHPFQSRVRAVQWPDGADHERLLTLLWADSDPVRHGTAQEMGHGVRIVCGVKFQPCLLGILLQQALPFQATAYTLTNQLNQVLQLVLVRRFDALEPGWPVVAIDVHAIQKQDVKVNIEVEGRSEALY
jgi:hypothetical protein